MKKTSPIVLILCVFNAFSVHAMTPDTMEPIIRHLDPESLSNLGNTNKQNAAIVKGYREGANVPKTARFSCPTNESVRKALQEASSGVKQVKMGETEWTFVEDKNLLAVSEDLLGQLTSIFIGQISALDDLEGAPEEGILCTYHNRVGLVRPFKPSTFRVKLETCQLDPKQFKVLKAFQYISGLYAISENHYSLPLPDGATVVCEQE